MNTPIRTERQVYCNRTLNMRSIHAIGYDMDYTLVHYHVEEWERRSYEYLKRQFIEKGWPVHSLRFEPERVCRGLIIDTERGNLIKTNRFGFIHQAMHGTQVMSFEAQREAYTRTIVELSDRRWVFLNTLFSLSEGCLYSQLVDLLDRREIPEVLGYADLYKQVAHVMAAAHMEGQLKAEIIADPERFVIPDPETALTLLDQYYAGKKLLLITNSEWLYTEKMMSFAFDRFLPKGMVWKDLFEIVVVSARKPHFFTTSSPFFEVVSEEGLLKPTVGHLRKGVAYLGGSADEIERFLNLSGDEILYVGDHMFGDVHVTKNVLRWRTALILRELEEEIRALQLFRETDQKIGRLMAQKENLEAQLCQLKIERQRRKKHYHSDPTADSTRLEAEMGALSDQVRALDLEIIPLAKKAGDLNNPTWGLLLRAGNNKSHLAFQMERYADIYSSRVSNFLFATPFAYLRSPRGSLPHDRDSF